MTGTLVNAAAITDRGTILSTPPELFDAMMATNLRAPFFLMQEAIRLMIRGDEPVAMGGINARAGEAVQSGGVFVPPEQRGLGYAGELVLAHLKELRAQGVRRASLFAASPAAERAYARIGFARIGAYRVALLGRPVILGMAA
jgi:predicted GNAT family acetyltransferase